MEWVNRPVTTLFLLAIIPILILILVVINLDFTVASTILNPSSVSTALNIALVIVIRISANSRIGSASANHAH